MSRHRIRVLVAAFCCPVLFAAISRGDRLNSTIKSSPTPANYRPQIQGLIGAQVKGLASEDPLTQKEARTTLIAECENHSGTTASPQYQTEYAADLARALLPAVRASSSIRFRVNAAVVTAEVAARVLRGEGDDSALSALVQSFLADKNPAVVLWGVKAAKFVMDSALSDGANAGPLSSAVVKSVTAHGASGFIVEEGYKTLTFEGLDKLKGNPQFAQMVTGVLPDLLGVLDWRAGQYRLGGDPPPSPQAERPVTVFLSVTAYPAVAANPAVRDRTLKGLGEMSCAILRTIAAGNSSPELIDMARDCGKAFDAFGQQMQNPTVQAAGKAISDISTNSDPTKLGALCEGLATSLKSIGVNINSEGSGAAGAPSDPALAGSAK